MVFIISALFIFGAVFGSFAAAQVWRLRARQLIDDKAHGEKVDTDEYKRLEPLVTTKVSNDRSRCLNCGHALAWYDLIPVVSWLSLGGKCRYCRKPIGYFEFVAELGLGLFFVISYLVWPFALTSPLMVGSFVLWLIASVVLLILFAYDLKWSLLPDAMNWLLAAVGALYALIFGYQQGFSLDWALGLIGAVAIMSGLYGAIYLLSRGSWVGFGDVKLGIGLGLLLGTWQNAFFALFLANLIGCIVIIPFMVARKLNRKSHIPFGPFLIAGSVISVFFGVQAVAWYTTTFLMLPL